MRENMEESNNLNKPQNIDNLSDDKFNKTQDVDEILNINEDDSSKIETNLLKIKKIKIKINTRIVSGDGHYLFYF